MKEVEVAIDPEEFGQYVTCDSNAICFGTLTDNEIGEVIEYNSDNFAKDSTEDIATSTSSFAEALYALYL